MIRAKILWVPSPYRAGFGITDDTDTATFEQVKAVYDFLISKRMVTTKTVWAYSPMEKCGNPATPDSTLRGITLQDTRYLLYCKMLAESGYEVCLHGASAGNNSSKSTLRALQLLQAEIGASDTFICHSKNAENMYWNEKITSRFPFHALIKLMNKHTCSGEDAQSPYFWGDVCASHINNIRLMRTRSINTLKRNPSMPYHSPAKPFVNGWFSATKRPIAECATPEALESLIRENGLTILYQYLHRYADPDSLILQRKFVEAVEAITSNSNIRIDTVSNHMRRLRLIQGVFVLYRDKKFWLVNTNNEPVPRLQIDLNESGSFESRDCTVKVDGFILTVKELPARSIVEVISDKPVRFEGRHCIERKSSGRIFYKFREGEIAINLSGSGWKLKTNLLLEPGTYQLNAKKSGTGYPMLSYLPYTEEFSLLCGQFWIVAREILFKGRSLNTNKFLDATKEIVLENHDNW
jgi:hypothetical protein